ncbi:MAG: site-2 protease family protein, partial [Clostridia bacterium]|nr:site-2 protease family protein [Clostridia bacterium]
MDIPTILLSIPAILIALTVHECAHGYAAYRLGDPTARALGRLSLNPLKHIDPLGALSMLLFRFGWARPVPIDTRYFRKPRRDMALTAACGPLSNFLLSFFGAFLYIALLRGFSALLSAVTVSSFVYLLMQYTLNFFFIFHYVNLTLGLFNCLPVPPLDGSRFLLVFLPPRAYFAVMRYERYISLALLLLLA